MPSPGRLRVALFLGVLMLAASWKPVPGLRAQAKRPMTLVDLLNIPRVLDPQMTRDGQHIAFTLRTADWTTNRRVDQMWLIRSDGSGLKRLTSADSGVGAAKAWSADGRTLAYLTRGSEPGLNIFLMPADGGTPRQLSHHSTGVFARMPGDIAWAPDGSALYFLANDPLTDEQQRREKINVTANDDFRQVHLWKIRVSDGTEQQLTTGAYSVTGLKVAANGSLVLDRGPTPLISDNYLNEVWSMKADGSDSIQLTRNKISEADAALSPDGTQLLFVARANDRQEPYYNANLFLMPATGGTPHAVLPTFPYEVLRAEWAGDGKSIWLAVNMGVHSEIFQLDLATRKPRQVTDGAHSIPELNVAGARQVFTIDEPTRFADVWTLDANATTPRRVTGVYDYLDRNFLLPREERVEWKGADGTTVEGLLLYPLDYRPGTRYPLVVQMHGGPEDSDKFSFGPVVWQGYQQVYAANGYAVLKPNYRGSSGYGNVFYRERWRAWTARLPWASRTPTSSWSWATARAGI